MKSESKLGNVAASILTGHEVGCHRFQERGGSCEGAEIGNHRGKRGGESPWDGWRTGDGEISDLRTSSNVFPNPQSDLPGLPL